jgi:glycosyltransferase involved in cell wall biosynthesis
MRVLHILPGLEISSGPTQALAALARHQARLGAEVTIAHLQGRGGGPPERLEHGIAYAGFQVRWLRYWGYAPGLGVFLRRQVGNFQVVHLHGLWLYPNVAGARACWGQAVPYLVRPAGSLEGWSLGQRRWLKGLYYRGLERRHLARAAALHAVSEQEAASLRGLNLPTRIEVIPNGVELEGSTALPSQAASRARLGLAPEAPVVLFLGRLHPKKGLDVLGEAFRRVRGELPEARLVVAGPDGHAFAAKVKEQYRELGILSAAVFLGELEGEDKAAAYRAADVFALASHSENFGLAVLESLAAGTPVVVSRQTPWEEVERAGAGFWVERSAEAFARALGRVLSDRGRGREMGERGRELVCRKYGWREVARRTLEVYEEVAPKGFIEH